MREHIAGMGGASKPAQNKKSYSVAEIQQILGISRPTAYALIKKIYSRVSAWATASEL